MVKTEAPACAKAAGNSYSLHLPLGAPLLDSTPPALENLDVAFQGLNTWHSFQYEAHGMIGSATGRPLRCPRLGPVCRRHRLDRRLCRALPHPARPHAPDRRLAGRRDAAPPLPLPPHRRRHHPAADGPEPRHRDAVVRLPREFGDVSRGLLKVSITVAARCRGTCKGLCNGWARWARDRSE